MTHPDVDLTHTEVIITHADVNLNYTEVDLTHTVGEFTYTKVDLTRLLSMSLAVSKRSRISSLYSCRETEGKDNIDLWHCIMITRTAICFLLNNRPSELYSSSIYLAKLAVVNLHV